MIEDIPNKIRQDGNGCLEMKVLVLINEQSRFLGSVKDIENYVRQFFRIYILRLEFLVLVNDGLDDTIGNAC